MANVIYICCNGVAEYLFNAYSYMKIHVKYVWFNGSIGFFPMGEGIMTLVVPMSFCCVQRHNVKPFPSIQQWSLKLLLFKNTNFARFESTFQNCIYYLTMLRMNMTNADN